MRCGSSSGRVLDDLGPERELARDVELPRLDQQRHVGRLGQLRMLLRRGRLDVDQPRVRVLRVVDGVLVALRDRELEVELDGGVRRAQQVEVAHGVRSDPVDQLVEGDEAPGALRHLALLEVDHLVKDDHQLLGVEAQRADRRLHARHVAVVVGAPHLDHAVEPALLEAAQQVAEVRGEVGRLAVGADDHAVLVLRQHLLAEAVLLLQGRPEPQRAVALLEVAGLAQPLDRRLRQARPPRAWTPRTTRRSACSAGRRWR